MSLLRRRMMQTEKSGAKYPLVNGRHEFSDGSFVEVSNGNHVLLQKGSDHIPGFFNLSDILQNTNDFNSANNINNKPTWFVIPAGTFARFELKNIQISGNFSGETNFRIANNFRSGSFHTGKFNAGNPDFNTMIETILEAPEEVGCLFLYFSGTADTQAEFDVEFTVNGERWI